MRKNETMQFIAILLFWSVLSLLGYRIQKIGRAESAVVQGMFWLGKYVLAICGFVAESFIIRFAIEKSWWILLFCLGYAIATFLAGYLELRWSEKALSYR